MPNDDDILRFTADADPLLDAVDAAARALQNALNPAFQAGSKVVSKFDEDMEELYSTVTVTVDGLNKVKLGIEGVGASARIVSREVQTTTLDVEKMADGFFAAVEAMDKYNRAQGDMEGRAQAEDIKRTTERLEEMQEAFIAAVAAQKALNDAAESASYAEQAAAIDEFVDAINRSIEAQDEAFKKEVDWNNLRTAQTAENVAREQAKRDEDLKKDIDWANLKIQIKSDEVQREAKVEAELNKMLATSRKELESQERDHYRALLEDKKRSEAEAARISSEARAKERNAAAFGASIGGSGSISFTSLGRAAAGEVSGLGVVGSAGLGLGVGLAAHSVESLISSMNEGAQRSVAFEQQIARIAAVSKNAADNQDAWRTAIQGLAVDLNVKSADVAAAAYEGLSKGSLKGAQDTKTLSEALKLSKVTGIDAKEAMTALNDIMSVYGASAGDAATNSELLFQAAKNGGINVAELGNSLSRVSPLALSMGVSVKEVVAALEVMRSKGITTGQAIAGLTQLLEELRKPSQLTKEALTQLGFASGQQAIATLGQVGAFQAVNEQIRKTGHDIAEVFPNIRALRTDLVLTGEAAGEYNSKLQELSTAHGGLNTALKTTTQAAGQEWEKMLNSWGVTADNAGKHINEVKDAIARILTGGGGFSPQQPSLPGSAAAEDELPPEKQTTVAGFNKAMAREQAKVKAAEAQLEQDRQQAAKLNYVKFISSTEADARGTLSSSDFEKFQQERANLGPDASSIKDRITIPDSIRQEFQTQKHIEAQQKAIEGYKAVYDQDNANLQAAGLKKEELYGKELEVLRKNSAGYLEELRKRVEATKEAEFKMQEGFAKSKYERSLLHIGDGKSQTAADAALKDAQDARVKVLSAQADEKLSHFDSLQGKAFTDSKDPEEIKQIQQEILKIYEQQAEAKLKMATTDRQRQDIEEDLAKDQQKVLDRETQLGDINQRHLSRAEDLDKYQSKNTKPAEASAALTALKNDVAGNKVSDIEMFQRLSTIHGMIGTDGFVSKDPTGSRAMEQFYATQRKLTLDEPSDFPSFKGDVGEAPLSIDQRRAAAARAAAAMGGFLGSDSPKTYSSGKGKISITGELENAGIDAANYGAAQEINKGSTLDQLSKAAEAADTGLKGVTYTLEQLKNIADTFGPITGKASKNGSRIADAVGSIFGGFSEGGPVPGVGNTDSYPAMLTPGEHVTNKRSSRTFAPLLEAINNYEGPSGGSNITNIGELNVSVEGKATSAQTVQEIGRGLEREFRRGTFKLRRY